MLPQKRLGGHSRPPPPRGVVEDCIAGGEGEERAAEGSVPAEKELSVWERAGSEGLNWKRVQYTSWGESPSAAPQSLDTGVDQAFDGTSTRCSYVARFLQK